MNHSYLSHTHHVLPDDLKGADGQSLMPKIVGALHAIAAKPDVTPSTLLIVTRRTCRILVAIRDDIWRERKQCLRTAVKAGRDLPWSAPDIEMLQDLALTHRRDEYEYARARLVEFGRLLSMDGSGIAERLGFERLCDILNVNPVRRATLGGRRSVSLRRLIFSAKAEDSADVDRDGLTGRGPLSEAFYAAYCDDLLQKCLTAHA
ncbi:MULTISPECIES: hypothetical protein [unclassified Pseudomonas]|uniref:hypothetical protein n=1 Tax=unclassified Pseudomonas TaxID=196821 RepID=UPI000D39072B|nr:MULTISPECIES: hypothetical protein [unclassified Pseudomonas]RAU43687.1 hypothetical protein DBP26_019355 [Pseudomonas sp. RIT 409]RAU54381.1 hypothetical protein DBY65_008615 [Pseudomonas sp. RIT 412]